MKPAKAADEVANRAQQNEELAAARMRAFEENAIVDGPFDDRGRRRPFDLFWCGREVRLGDRGGGVVIRSHRSAAGGGAATAADDADERPQMAQMTG